MHLQGSPTHNELASSHHDHHSRRTSCDLGFRFDLLKFQLELQHVGCVSSCALRGAV